MPPLDSMSAQTKWSHIGTTSCKTAAETASKGPVITESLTKSVYCKRLETGTIPIQPGFWEVNFNFGLTAYPET
jgi:hypothetical protein